MALVPILIPLTPSKHKIAHAAKTFMHSSTRQSTKVFTLGHSPDPDDAFMFYAMAENKIDSAVTGSNIDWKIFRR